MEKPRAAPSERRRIEGLVEAVADLRDPEDLARSAFLREIADAGLDRFHRISLSVEELSLDRLAEHAAVLLAATSGEHGRVQNALVRIEDVALGLVRPGHGRNAVTIVLAGEDGAALVEVGRQLGRALGDAPDADARVRVCFWSGGSGALGGAYGSMRRLDMPPLNAIRDNYSPAVLASLARLASIHPPDLPPGRLILWHGAAGTGKTWALRALGREWRDWCDLQYVTDPERLLGGDGSYMMDLLLGSDEPDWIPDHDDDSSRWRLLVLEDAGELLAVDAPARVGLGFSRLLNTVDGLIGQGTRAVVLVTTNEPLGKLHPAVTRAGRRLAETEFTPLAREEAQRWLTARGVERALSGPTSIADLYALIDERERSPEQSAVGFG
ncbi:MAG: hypothetical protein ACRDN8_09715 [Thermoleophilaceae bacterium]